MAEIVKICAYCQKEFPEVDKAVKDNRNKITFSHGICQRHAAEVYKQMGMNDDWIKKKLSQNPNPVPDLKAHPELVKLYSQGIFTPEEFKHSQTEPTLKEIFQKRAGIGIRS